MAANFETLTIQDIADLIGIKLTNPELITFIEQNSKKYLKEVIKQANAFCTSTRAYRLEPTHIQMALQANGMKPLLGYDSIPKYMSIPSIVDQADIYGARENSIELKSILKGPIPIISNDQTHHLRWTLIEGSYSGRITSPARQSRQSKALERSVSVPAVSATDFTESRTASTPSNMQFSNSDPLDKSNQSELQRCAFDILNSEHQDYFISTIKNLRCDIVNSLDIDLDMISEESKSQPLLPYFLQFIIGKLTLELNDQKQLKVLIRFTLALLQNRYLNIPLFAHPFLRIVLTCLLHSNLTTNDSISSYSFIDTDIRRYASQALSVFVYRCENAFPDLKEVIFNSLTDTLFNPNITLWAQYGALLGIKEIGMIEQLLPHLGSYLKFVIPEFKFSSQASAAEAIVQLVNDILDEFRGTTKSEQGKEIAQHLIDEIHSLSSI